MDERFTERFENYIKDATSEQKKNMRAKRIESSITREDIKGVKEWFYKTNTFMSSLEIIVAKYGQLVEVVEETEKAVYLVYHWEYEKEFESYEGWFPKSALEFN